MAQFPEFKALVPPPPYAQRMHPQAAVDSASQDVAAAEHKLKAAHEVAQHCAEQDELTSKLDAGIALAGATVHLLWDIKGIASGNQLFPAPRDTFVQFKPELNAVAKEYGYKVVPVGNKSKAVVVQQ